MAKKLSAGALVKDVQCEARKQSRAGKKIRMVRERLSGESSNAERSRAEGGFHCARKRGADVHIAVPDRRDVSQIDGAVGRREAVVYAVWPRRPDATRRSNSSASSGGTEVKWTEKPGRFSGSRPVTLA